ncbi:HD domain-containing protein [Deinococcus metallilatus]|uniref:HD domain-containing protein n=1 Tax=Deinococcus metallilatus TaxID=1211322 RepID=A0AAJ5F7C1_9DEIO|nr:HD domain-containing phosphohydrolase [Deinococcus metallilatus]MBB5296374.1 putative nucleotidyltransferase with HDIG domain [Deinococcus metallilatus]QBY09949.1 HD domain-containing protein [Deinococcus metallilatus]RXJ08673.1 HD domain-containing protein [Deinococcus metallilatus]TLK25147.1 HD domain-containing protein [Deinococcus metallilatus]GMA14713.1 phosphohydrolase [Deinococcus metallilatus]
MTAFPFAGEVPTAPHDLSLHLTRLGLTAPDLGSAMQPVLDVLVSRTAAVGAGYFQLRDTTLAYHARAASGDMPQGPLMEALLAHGLPPELPLVGALREAGSVLFFEDTRAHPHAAGFADLGVLALTAAPVCDQGGRLVGALLSHVFTPHAWSGEERRLVGTITGLLTLLAARLDAEERERDAHESALRALGLMLEARDAETHGHTDRVTALALRLGRALGLSETELRDLRWGAYLHDIGKIGIPDEVLHCPGTLDAAARARMQGHVTEGARLAAQLPFLSRAALDVIAGHHECWDGSGYPCGLAGEAIPLHARIFAACDVYDALISVRPYKRAWPHAEAAAHLARCSGTHFDPAVVTALLRVLDEEAPAASA